MSKKSIILGCLVTLVAMSAVGQMQKLSYAPAPVDNPLRGLTPYQGRAGTNFPCSMEFNYLPLNAVVKGAEQYDWAALDNILNDVVSRGRQTVFRFFLDYPGKPCSVPDYLVRDGVKITEWQSDNTYSAKCLSPDYNDPRLRACMTNFIAALGKRYDGDPRVAFITAGMLGSWGEWHTYPRTDLWAANTVQSELLDAYERAFKTTRILVRYPAGQNDPTHCSNAERPMGYHDDSFAFATTADGTKNSSWYFMNLMKKAATLDKWNTQPIGGEVRPEVWGCCYDEPGCEPKGQEFASCIEQTHVTWLMDSGAFKKTMTPQRIEKASRLVRRMGYEFYVAEAGATMMPDKSLEITVAIENKGVAPFYYAWPFELAALDGNGKLTATWRPGWKITEIASGTRMNWKHTITQSGLKSGAYKILLRVVNPLPLGRTLCFANSAQNADKDGWLIVGQVVIP